MNVISATVHVFESQVDVPQQNGCRVNKTYLSVEMPQDIRDFVAIASDPTERIQSGFAPWMVACTTAWSTTAGTV